MSNSPCSTCSNSSKGLNQPVLNSGPSQTGTVSTYSGPALSRATFCRLIAGLHRCTHRPSAETASAAAARAMQTQSKGPVITRKAVPSKAVPSNPVPSKAVPRKADPSASARDRAVERYLSAKNQCNRPASSKSRSSDDGASGGVLGESLKMTIDFLAELESAQAADKARASSRANAPSNGESRDSVLQPIPKPRVKLPAWTKC